MSKMKQIKISRAAYLRNPGAFIEAYQFELDAEKRAKMWNIIKGSFKTV